MAKKRLKGARIYYGDGSIYTIPKEGDWYDAPNQDVQVIIVYFNEVSGSGKHLRNIVSCRDFYYLTPTNVCATDDLSEAESSSDHKVLFGRWCLPSGTPEQSFKAFSAIMKIAIEDHNI